MAEIDFACPACGRAIRLMRAWRARRLAASTVRRSTGFRNRRRAEQHAGGGSSLPLSPLRVWFHAGCSSGRKAGPVQAVRSGLPGTGKDAGRASRAQLQAAATHELDEAASMHWSSPNHAWCTEAPGLPPSPGQVPETGNGARLARKSAGQAIVQSRRRRRPRHRHPDAARRGFRARRAGSDIASRSWDSSPLVLAAVLGRDRGSFLAPGMPAVSLFGEAQENPNDGRRHLAGATRNWTFPDISASRVELVFQHEAGTSRKWPRLSWRWPRVTPSMRNPDTLRRPV